MLSLLEKDGEIASLSSQVKEKQEEEEEQEELVEQLVEA